MKAITSAPRWAVSFADLGLLLLGCFVLLHAIEARRPAAADGNTQPVVARGESLQADMLFEAGEARLTEAGRARLQALAQGYARGVEIISRGAGERGLRLDRFELGAARTAAVARTLRDHGVSEAAIALRVESSGLNEQGQRITLTRR